MRDHHRLDTAAELRLLVDALEAAWAPRAIDVLAQLADPTWPAGGGGRGPTGGGTGSRVERVALDGGSRPVGRAVEILAELEGLADRARRVRLGLGECKADRPIEAYPCGHPVDRRFTRCQVTVDGVQCGTGSTTERRCANRTCDKVLEPGDRTLDGRCDTCARFRRRTGRDRIVTEGLALSDGLLVEGVYVAEVVDV